MVVLSILGGCALVLGLWLAWWNVRRVRTAQLAAAIARAVQEQVLEAIDRAGMEEGTRVLLLRVVDGPPRDPYSKLGGEPLLPPGVATDAGPPDDVGKLLVQVRLHSPPLPEVWLNRVLLLFRDQLRSVVARCTVPADSVADANSAASSAKQRGLEVLRLPPGDTVGEEDAYVSSPYAPGSLCRRVPALRDLLAPYADTPERVLPHVLVPGIHTHEIDTFLVCLMGGEPELIQDEHGASCPRCARPMRFLLHFGDVLKLPGDAPVLYVYGCDEHPAEVRSYVDIH